MGLKKKLSLFWLHFMTLLKVMYYYMADVWEFLDGERPGPKRTTRFIIDVFISVMVGLEIFIMVFIGTPIHLCMIFWGLIVTACTLYTILCILNEPMRSPLSGRHIHICPDCMDVFREWNKEAGCPYCRFLESIGM